MRIRRVVSALLFLACAAGLSFGQDLNRLQSRAQKLLDLRSSLTSDRRVAAQYVEAGKRQEFQESNPLPMLDAHVTGFELTSDPKLVYVVFHAKVMLPDIGPVPRTGREPWVWDKNQWFLRIEETADVAALTKKGSIVPPAKLVPLEFSPKRIDLGKHVQGEFVKGTIQFKSDRDEVLLFRQPDLPGLSFGAPSWTSKEEGQLDFVLDTTLMFEDVRYVPEFVIDGQKAQRTVAEFELVAQIEPRLRITQEPRIVDPSKVTPVQIRIENLSKTPFSFKNAIMTSEAYSLLKEPMGIVNPGQTATFIFAHAAQAEPLGAQLLLEMSEPVLGRKRISVPVNIKLPAPPVVGFTREQLEQIIRDNTKK